MEAALLMADVVGITLVLLWAARGLGTAGLFAWRADVAKTRVAKRPSMWLAAIALALSWAARGFGVGSLLARRRARARRYANSRARPRDDGQ